MTYFNRIGGRYAITMRAWLLLLPLSMFGTVSFTPEGPQGVIAIFIGWLVGLLVHLIMGLVMLVARFTYLHNGDRNSRPFAAIATFLVAGATRGLSVAFLFETFGVVAQADYLERMIAGAVLTLILFATAAILVDSRNAYRDAVAKLESERTQARELAERGEQQLIEQRNQLLSLIRTTLSETLRSAQSSAQLHDAVEQVVRPLSHNLAGQARLVQLDTGEAISKKVRFLPAVRTGLERYPFNISATLMISLTATAYSRAWAFGWLAVPDLLLMALTITLGFALLRRLKVRGWWAVLGIVLVGAASSALTFLLVGSNPVTELSGVILLSLNISLPAVGVTFFKGFEAERAKRLEELKTASAEAQWQRSLIQSRAWVEQQRLGRFVHSELQGRIRATALRATREHGTTLPAEVVQDLEEECLRAIDLTVDEPDLDAFIANTVELWHGVAEVRFDLSPQARDALDADPWATTALIEISREAISNATKHGSASSVQISVDKAEGTTGALRFEATDNGSKVANGQIQSGAHTASATGGLGLSTIAEFTLESQLELTESGAVLTALIATRPVGLALV